LPLAACNDSAPEQSTGAKTTAPAAKKAMVSDNMVAAVSAGKTSTVIGVYFELGGAPSIDSALPVEIAILPRQDFTSLKARFYTQGDGLTLVSGDLLQPVNNAQAGSSIEHQLVLMPRKEGVFMLSVNIETEGAEGSVSRIFFIPVIVAPTSAATPEAPAPAGAAPPRAPATN
jgi:hypothetical protein